jgi:UDP-N-acetylglucosamine acyltransferase
MIHPSAIIHPKASLGDGVEVGPYAVIGEGVVLGERCLVGAHAVIEGPTVLGEANVVSSFAVLGGSAQHRAGGEGALRIGARNVFREHVTVHRGTRASTLIGDDNLFMVSSHVAHDVVVGSHVTVANAVQLAGHARVSDYVTFGGLSGIAQFVVVGESAFVAAGAMCEKDVLPFVVVQGDRARVRALNTVGLKRRGFDAESIARLERAFRALFVRRVPRAQALAELPPELRADPHVAKLIAAVT